MTEPFHGPELYLIQHKVNGEATFDIAAKITTGGKGKETEGWIMPTTWKRVYPYWWRRLSHVCLISNADQTSIVALAKRVPLPDDWPDYQQEGE